MFMFITIQNRNATERCKNPLELEAYASDIDNHATNSLTVAEAF
jgi:hypothetical protein